jgi:hypothetical protein
MKSASSKEIKSALQDLSNTELSDLCLRLARFKLENKELLTYLLFEAQDEAAFVQLAKQEIQDGFDSLNTSSVFFIKKGIRKIIRIANKYIRYSGKDETAAEILLEILTQFRPLEAHLKKSTVLKNMYIATQKKWDKSVESMHEDLQFDYFKSLQKVVLHF